jgi:hypothetical protein
MFAPLIDVFACMARGWRHDVAAVTAHVEAVSSAAWNWHGRRWQGEIQVQAACRFHDCGSGQGTVLSDQRLQRCEAAGAVDVNEDESRDGAGSNSDVGRLPFDVPFIAVKEIRRAIRTAWKTGRSLLDRLTHDDVSSRAGQLCNGSKAEVKILHFDVRFTPDSGHQRA